MFRTLIKELIAHSLPVERLQSYLPFHTVIRHGQQWNHIVNASVFTVETQHHVIYEGQSLCARRRQTMRDTKGEATCPGCLAHARSIVLRTITD